MKALFVQRRDGDSTAEQAGIKHKVGRELPERRLVCYQTREEVWEKCYAFGRISLQGSRE